MAFQYLELHNKKGTLQGDLNSTFLPQRILHYDRGNIRQCKCTKHKLLRIRPYRRDLRLVNPQSESRELSLTADMSMYAQLVMTREKYLGQPYR